MKTRLKERLHNFEDIPISARSSQLRCEDRTVRLKEGVMLFSCSSVILATRVAKASALPHTKMGPWSMNELTSLQNSTRQSEMARYEAQG
jgi:hypothetical protein